jgi:hypothetical protein
MLEYRMTFDEAAPLLEAVGMAEASQDALDLPQLADELQRSVDGVREQLAELDGWGLLLTGEEGLPPMLLDAGRQYLRARGVVDDAVLNFLPKTLDDLIARRAVMEAGSNLVDEFAYQVARGRAVEHAQEIVPPAFADAMTARLAIDLFAATVALIARLANDTPAGCVAEEIIAVHLIEETKASLDLACDEGTLERNLATKAAAELNSLFDLFQDDDVLGLFEMREPADAAVANNDPISHQMGIADQRIEAWFEPFWGLPAAGHLARRTDRPRVLSALRDRFMHVVAPDEVLAAGEMNGEFRVCIRIWEDGFAQRADYDRLPPTWTYYVHARTAYEAERHALDRFPSDAAVSPAFDEDAMFDSSEIARFSIDVQRVGLDQSVKATNGGFHIVGTIELGERFLPGLAGWLQAVFPAAVVAQDSSAQYLAVSVNAESHEEADADLDDALRGFAASAGLEDEVIVQQSSCAHGARDAAQLLTEIERFHPVRLEDEDEDE